MVPRKVRRKSPFIRNYLKSAKPEAQVGEAAFLATAYH
jgi:hypothetical protein